MVAIANACGFPGKERRGERHLGLIARFVRNPHSAARKQGGRTFLRNEVGAPGKMRRRASRKLRKFGLELGAGFGYQEHVRVKRKDPVRREGLPSRAQCAREDCALPEATAVFADGCDRCSCGGSCRKPLSGRVRTNVAYDKQPIQQGQMMIQPYINEIGLIADDGYTKESQALPRLVAFAQHEPMPRQSRRLTGMGSAFTRIFQLATRDTADSGHATQSWQRRPFRATPPSSTASAASLADAR